MVTHTGTDEKSLKNVLGAERVGVSTSSYVGERSDEFETLTDSLGLNLTDFIRTIRGNYTGKSMNKSWQAIDDLNATISHEEPWKLDTEPQSHILSAAADGLTKIASELAPFLPNTSASIMTALADGQQTQLFPRASW